MSAGPRCRRTSGSSHSARAANAGGASAATISIALPRPSFSSAGCPVRRLSEVNTVATASAESIPAPAANDQLRPDGSLRHLLTLEGLSRAHVEALLERAQGFARVHEGERPNIRPSLRGVTVANLFTEPSTRTRVSFELAAKRLGAEVVNLEVQLSSRVKGESMLDTVFTLEALHVDALVIREAESGVLELVARSVGPHVSVLSGGEAHVSHPTQGLLDALTVRQCKGKFDGLSIAIVGDVRHSRVARSAYQVFQKLGVPDLRIVAPAAFMPESKEFEGCARHASLRTGLKDVDVVM